MTFGIDVDEVLRSLCQSMIDLYNGWFDTKMTIEDIHDFDVDVSFPKIKKQYGISASQWFFQEHGYELFYESPALKGAVEAVNKLKEYGQVYIITYQKSIHNKIDTLKWLTEHGIQYDGVCFVKDKSIIHLDFLIDDNDWNFIGCNCDTGVLITAPYNKDMNIGEILKKSNCKQMVRCDSLEDFLTYFHE